MSTESYQQQEDTQTRWARRAHYVAIGSWALAALAPGTAAALAQYASLADVNPDPINAAAVLVVCVGIGGALLGWFFWAAVHFRLQQQGYRAPVTTVAIFHALFALLFWLALLVAGSAVTGWSGSSDSIAPLVLLAFGLGIAGAIAGFLGLINWAVSMQAQSTSARRAVRAELRAAAKRQGREVQEPPAIRIALGLLGVIVGAVLLLSCAGSAPPLAQALGLPLVAGVIGVLVIGAVVLFPSFWFLTVTAAGDHTLFPIPNVNGYALRASTAVTVALLMVSILTVVGLGILAILPFLALGYLGQRMRARYWPPGAF